MSDTIKKIQAGTITYDIEPAQSAAIEVTNNAPTLSWGNTSTIATVDGTAITVKMPANPDTNTTYVAATTTAAGLMSAADKVKLNGIATGANKVTKANATGNTTTVASNAHTHAGPSHTHTYAKATSASFTGSSVNSGSPTVIASGTSSSTTVVAGSLSGTVLTLTTTTVASTVHGHSVTASGTISLSHTSTNSGSGGTGNTGAPSANTTVPTSGHTHGLS